MQKIRLGAIAVGMMIVVAGCSPRAEQVIPQPIMPEPVFTGKYR